MYQYRRSIDEHLPSALRVCINTCKHLLRLRSLLRFGYYSANEQTAEVSKACMRWMNEELGPEDIALNISVQKGLHSMGYDQGRYMIDAERSNESEHLVHHFHRLVFQGIHGAQL